jgi:hypothetical protein
VTYAAAYLCVRQVHTFAEGAHQVLFFTVDHGSDYCLYLFYYPAIKIDSLSTGKPIYINGYSWKFIPR